MVFAILTVSWVGLLGYKIRSTSSGTLFSFGLILSDRAYPSLELTGLKNLSKPNLSLWEAQPFPFYKKLYTSAHRSSVHAFGSLLSVLSHWFVFGVVNTRTISSLFRFHECSSTPSFPILVRAFVWCCFSASSLGTHGTTESRVIVVDAMS